MFLGPTPTSTELVFLAAALGGTLFFIFRVMLILVAGVGAEDVGEMDSDLHAQGAHDTEVAFKLVSLNSISAFFMMFGWTGLTLYVEFKAGEVVAIFGGLTVGFLMMIFTAWFFKFIKSFTSKGADFKLEEVVGQTAEVYQRIPADGQGKVHITYNGMLRELSARSNNGSDIESFTKVTITGLSGATGVEVSPA